MFSDHSSRIFWRSALRLAWTDLKTARARSALVILSAAVSIAGIAGVSGAAQVAREALTGDSRAWLGGDIGVDLREPMNQEQAATLDRTPQIEWTLVANAVSMAASRQSPDAAFIGVKAVDPTRYPFYGAVTLTSGKSLRESLTPETVVVSQEVLERLSVRVGDEIQIAGQPFRIAGLIAGEPDRFSGVLGLGMRSIVSRDGYARTHLEESGASVSHRILVRFDGDLDFRLTRHMLELLFPGSAIREYRTAYGRQVDAAATFLSVAAFLTLILGAMGVGISVRQHADDSMAKLAILKILGGGSAHSSAVFLIQVAIMICAAILVGAPLGFGVEMGMLRLARKYLTLPPGVYSGGRAIVVSVLASVIVMGAPALKPALNLWRLRPAVMLRDADIARTGRSEPNSPLLWLAGAVACLAFLFLGRSVVGSWRYALLLAGTLAASFFISWALAGLALSQTKRWGKTALHSAPPWLRLGLAGLHRPRNRSRLLIAALAVAFLSIIATLETGGEVVSAVFDLLPYRGASLYVVRFRNSQRENLTAFLEKQPGVKAVHLIAQTRLRLRRVYPFTDPLDLSYNVACEPPAFFGPPSTQQLSRLVVADDVARSLKIHPGVRMQFESPTSLIDVEVADVRKLTPAERVWSTLHMDCSALDPGNLYYQAAVETDPASTAPVRRALMEEFPTFAVLTASDIADTVDAVTHDAVALVQIVGWLAISAGLGMMLAIVAAARGPRLREIGILSALGARRTMLIRIYTVEFAAIGALSGIIAALLSLGFASTVLSLTFREFRLAQEWKPVAEAVVAAIVLTAAASWLPAWGLLRKKPMEVLRSQTTQ